MTGILQKGLTFGVKSYTSNGMRCLLTKLSTHPTNKEVPCMLSGGAPIFTVTVSPGDIKSWIREGSWKFTVTNERGNASIIFELLNNTKQGG